MVTAVTTSAPQCGIAATIDAIAAQAMLALALVALVAAGCAEVVDGGSEEAFTDHGVASDFDPVQIDKKGDGVSNRFDRALVLEDGFFEDTDWIGVEGVQAFLDETPYGTTSWMATADFNGRRPAEIIVDSATRHQINPVLILARLQVEAGTVSFTSRPSESRINKAMGCGCPDGAGCSSLFSGFERQIECGAETMRRLFDGSADGSGIWVAGVRKRTLDGISVTPVNHATAALYAYTPWVLEGRGGTWLAWNVTRRYEKHVLEQGLAGAFSAPWIGAACGSDADCAFSADGHAAFCMHYDAGGTTAGFCSIPCEGYCPDKTGTAPTFCAAIGGGEGICASQADPLNSACGDIVGTTEVTVARFTGSSGAPAKNADVCLP